MKILLSFLVIILFCGCNKPNDPSRKVAYYYCIDGCVASKQKTKLPKFDEIIAEVEYGSCMNLCKTMTDYP